MKYKDTLNALGIEGVSTDLELFQELLDNPKTKDYAQSILKTIRQEKNNLDIELNEHKKITDENAYKKFRQRKMEMKSKKKRAKKRTISYINAEKINKGNWRKFIAYYRTHIDEFCLDVLKVRLYDFQRVIIRCMVKFDETMFIASRGIGKSYLSAIFFIATAILYPQIKLGIASGKGQQARNVIIQKIKGELANNPNILNEIKGGIKGINTGANDCYVPFKNGSEIRAIVLGTDGDNARSWRFQYLLIDEARLVKEAIIEEILVPMTKTERERVINLKNIAKDLGKPQPTERGKVIYITSAYLKSCDLYKRFCEHYESMMKGDNDKFFVCCIPYEVGVEAGIFTKDSIESERNKVTMTQDRFDYEYNALFVGASAGSYYPYELTNPRRTLEKVELEEAPEDGREYFYVICHDVATSEDKRADNNCTGVIKCIDNGTGIYTKRLVFLTASKGKSVPEQAEFIREVYHRFPSTRKIVIDINGSGETLPNFLNCFYTPKGKSMKDTQKPLVLDSIEDYERTNNVNPIVRGVKADSNFNKSFYLYTKSIFEDGTFELPLESMYVIDDYKVGDISQEELEVFTNVDLYTKELSNIKQQVNEKSQKIEFVRVSLGTKRDRVTSIGYGLSYIMELESENRKDILTTEDEEDDVVIVA